MTPEQADKLRDAINTCRQTSRALMMTDNGIDALAAENADDAARDEVNRLISELTR